MSVSKTCSNQGQIAVKSTPKTTMLRDHTRKRQETRQREKKKERHTEKNKAKKEAETAARAPSLDPP